MTRFKFVALLFLLFLPAVTYAEGESKFAVGIGTAYNSFGGNIGKLYSASAPSIDVSGLVFFSQNLALQLGINNSDFDYDASPDGFVEVNLLSLDFGARYYLTPSQLRPFVNASVSQVSRERTFFDLGLENEKVSDTALGLSGGIGLEYLFLKGKASFELSANMKQIFMKERLSNIFEDVGVPDQTGALYSFASSVRYYF